MFKNTASGSTSTSSPRKDFYSTYKTTFLSFPPAYVPFPAHRVLLLSRDDAPKPSPKAKSSAKSKKGKAIVPLSLPPMTEEVATFWCTVLGGNYEKSEIFRNNFWKKSFLPTLKEEIGLIQRKAEVAGAV